MLGITTTITKDLQMFQENCKENILIVYMLLNFIHHQMVDTKET